jgi:hypothetical protein
VQVIGDLRRGQDLNGGGPSVQGTWWICPRPHAENPPASAPLIVYQGRHGALRIPESFITSRSRVMPRCRPSPGQGEAAGERTSA